MKLRYKIAGASAAAVVTAALVLVFLRTFAGAASEVNIIPAPQNAERRPGVFQVTAQTRIQAEPGAQEAAKFLVARLEKSIGYSIKPEPFAASTAKGTIVFAPSDNKTVGKSQESYALTVS